MTQQEIKAYSQGFSDGYDGQLHHNSFKNKLLHSLYDKGYQEGRLQNNLEKLERV